MFRVDDVDKGTVGTLTRDKLQVRWGSWIAQAAIVLLLLAVAAPLLAARKPKKQLTATDGQPIRKVFIRAASPETARSVAASLAQDTCLTLVPKEEQADAVLDAGVALPGIGGVMPAPNVFVPSATTQPLSNSKNGHIHSASVTCNNDKSSGCGSSDNLQGGDLGPELPPGFADADSRLDISLISTGKASQELWEPENSKKRPWTDQLRVAVGCPVCPGKHFNRKRDKSYRDWMHAECPEVLSPVAAP